MKFFGRRLNMIRNFFYNQIITSD